MGIFREGLEKEKLFLIVKEKKHLFRVGLQRGGWNAEGGSVWGQELTVWHSAAQGRAIPSAGSAHVDQQPPLSMAHAVIQSNKISPEPND